MLPALKLNATLEPRIFKCYDILFMLCTILKVEVQAASRCKYFANTVEKKITFLYVYLNTSNSYPFECLSEFL